MSSSTFGFAFSFFFTTFGFFSFIWVSAAGSATGSAPGSATAIGSSFFSSITATSAGGFLASSSAFFASSSAFLSLSISSSAFLFFSNSPNRSPYPHCPSSFRPQQYTSPSSVLAILWCSPPAISTT